MCADILATEEVYHNCLQLLLGSVPLRGKAYLGRAPLALEEARFLQGKDDWSVVVTINIITAMYHVSTVVVSVVVLLS